MSAQPEITLNDTTIDFTAVAISSKNWRQELDKKRRVLRSQFDATQYERSDLSWYHTAFLEHKVFLYDTSV